MFSQAYRIAASAVVLGFLSGCATELDEDLQLDDAAAEEVEATEQAYNESTCRTVTPNKTWSVAYESYEILTADPPYGVTDCPDQAVFAFTNTKGINYDVIPDGSFQKTAGGTTYNTVLSGLSQSECSGYTMEVRYHFKTGSSWSSPSDKKGVYTSSWVSNKCTWVASSGMASPIYKIKVTGGATHDQVRVAVRVRKGSTKIKVRAQWDRLYSTPPIP